MTPFEVLAGLFLTAWVAGTLFLIVGLSIEAARSFLAGRRPVLDLYGQSVIDPMAASISALPIDAGAPLGTPLA